MVRQSRLFFVLKYKFGRLGVKTRIFHLADYRRATIDENKDMPDDYFFVNASATSIFLRQKILKKCREDLYAWLDRENGQVAIYDAVNPHAEGRRALAMEFEQRNIQVLPCRTNPEICG